MMRRRMCAGTLVLGALVGCSSGGATGPVREGARSPESAPVAADSGPSAAEGGVEPCLLRGREDLAARRWADAERRLEKAWEVDGRAEIAADLGRVEAELGKAGEAGAHLSAALDGGVGAVEAQLSALRPRLGALALRSGRPGARVAVFVDGWRATHRLPGAELWLSPGKHEVELRAGARVVARTSVDVEIGQRADWEVPDLGALGVDVPAGGAAAAGGGLAAGGAVGGTLAAGGAVGGTLAAGGGLAAAGGLDAVGGIGGDVGVKAPDAGGGLSTPLIVVGGIVGAAAIGIGTGLAVAASDLGAGAAKIEADLKADADVELPCEGANRQGHEAECALLEGKLKDQEIFLGIGVPVLVTAGLVVAGGLTYILWPRAKAPDAKVELCGITVRPGVGPGSFSLQGTF